MVETQGEEEVRRRVLAAGHLPLPGAGRTSERFAGLAAIGATDLSTGRLAEGHADAVAILAEAGRQPRPAHLYGVWAAVSGDGDVLAESNGTGWQLSGTKQFCSGAGLCDRALVRAGGGGEDLLFDVDLRQVGIRPVEGTWPAVGMAGSDSRAVRFDAAAVEGAAALGPAGWYVQRPGFWHGGAGVAAVWAGGARGLLEATAEALGPGAGEGELSMLGAAAAHVEAMEALLARAAQGIDDDPTDSAGDGRWRALTTRQAVHSGATAVLVATAGAGGARPLCLDASNAQRAADLHVYLAQHHPGRDGAALGRLALESRRPAFGGLDAGGHDAGGHDG